jgi:hypothetical protein
MGCSFGGLTADYCAASPDTAEPRSDVAIFMPVTLRWATVWKYLFYIMNITTPVAA